MASLAVYTVNMSIGAGAGFCGVAIPQVRSWPVPQVGGCLTVVILL